MRDREPGAAAVERLRRRSDFRATASGVRASGRAFVLQARRRADDGVVRVGFTVSKQVGNAVERNRVRRRLRELVRVSTAASPPGGGLHAGHDYVLVGRRAALETPFGEMVRELDLALARVHALERSPTGEGRPGSLHEAGSRSGRPRPQGQRRRPAECPQSME